VTNGQVHAYVIGAGAAENMRQQGGGTGEKGDCLIVASFALTVKANASPCPKLVYVNGKPDLGSDRTDYVKGCKELNPLTTRKMAAHRFNQTISAHGFVRSRRYTGFLNA
jgi:hypothetical protein